MMLYRNTKVKVRTPGDTDYFDIVAGVLQGDTMKDNSLKLTKERNKRFPAQIITDADYAIALLANTPA